MGDKRQAGVTNENRRLEYTRDRLIPLRDMADAADDQFVAYALEMVICEIEERLPETMRTITVAPIKNRD